MFIMTSKEKKANQLVGEFEKKMLSISLHQTANKEVAKQCALVALEAADTQVKNFSELVLDESYLLFVGYDYCSTGFMTGTFNMSGYFEVQNSLPVEFEDVKVFELPEIK